MELTFSLGDVPLAPWGSLSTKSPGKGWGTVCKIGKENAELTHMEIKPKTLPSNLLTGPSEDTGDAF